MPATKTEITDKYQFKGDVLDRTFDVYKDTKSGEYAYDYAEITPVIATALDSVKYYRISSPKLSEIEQELAKHVKAQAPRAKGEITKAAEEQASKLNLGKKPEESLLRTRKVEYAKSEQEKILESYEERLARGEAVNINATTKRAKLSPDDQADYDSLQTIIDAFDDLISIEEKEKRGEVLTPQEQATKQASIQTIDGFALPADAMPTPSTKINDKRNYNAAVATVTSLREMPDDQLSMQQRKNINSAVNVIRTYQTKYPETNAKRREQIGLIVYTEAKKKLDELSKKPQPLGQADLQEQAVLQQNVDDFTAAFPELVEKEDLSALQEPGYKNIFNESAPNVPAPELSNAALQARRGKAQRILNYFTGPTAPVPPLSTELTNLQRSAQEVRNAFATLNNPASTANEKKSATNIVRKSSMLNKARNLSVPTEGGKRKTKKAKKSKKRRHTKKH